MRTTILLSISAMILITSCVSKKKTVEISEQKNSLVQEKRELTDKMANLESQIQFLEKEIEMIELNRLAEEMGQDDFSEEDVIVNIAEIMPSHPSGLGINELIDESRVEVSSNVKPGVVYIETVVLANGILSEMKGIGNATTDQKMQAIKLLQSTSPWTPGEIDGRKVKVRMVIPITFK